MLESLRPVTLVQLSLSIHQLVEQFVEESDDVIVLALYLVLFVGKLLLANLSG